MNQQGSSPDAGRRLRPRRLLGFLSLALPLTMLLGTMAGPVWIPVSDWFAQGAAADYANLIIGSIRFPRIMLAAVVGALLAVCGAMLQGLFRNPLADPTLIGVSAGASVGAGLVIVLGELLLGLQAAGFAGVATGAFIGGLSVALLVYRLATGPQGTSVSTMLLAGIAVSAMAGALNSLFGFFSDNEALRRISLWQMGNLDHSSWLPFWICATVLGVFALRLPGQSAALNAFLLGESEARHLGIDVDRCKRQLIGLTALGVGVAVAVAGTIAFVGLMVPHAVRMLIGPDHRYLLPASALAGAVLLILADTLARVLIAPSELPTGVVTAMLGAPFFVFLLRHRRAML